MGLVFASVFLYKTLNEADVEQNSPLRTNDGSSKQNGLDLEVYSLKNELNEKALSSILDHSEEINLQPSEITQADFERAMRNSEAWMESRGYTFNDEFIEEKNRANLHHGEFFNDYNTYTLEQLETLAYQNDPRAQLYYGLRLLKGNLNSGELWLKKSISSGNYTSAISSLTDAYLTKIDDLRQSLYRRNSDGIMTKIANNSGNADKFNEEEIENQINEFERKIYIWALTAKKLNDPFAALDVEFLPDNHATPTHDFKAYKTKSDVLYEELSHAREQLGYDKFSSQQLNNRDFFVLNNFTH